MRELPGDVFVTGQLLPAQLQALAEQGVMGFINNRPDMEAPLQPTSDELEQAAHAVTTDYYHIPMAGGITPGIIQASKTAYATMPRPIVAWCASGMRSAVLWGFAHVDKLGVDGVMASLTDAGFNLEQIRAPLTDYMQSLNDE
ncbi:TIGR01244 family sulfur transferase [Litorimonas sp. RW-G-Af-16]|uniref:TIGR01244 family sulfur transferase n=1 Tax=Litorimonas sp. RW-G-Af-16 TaxID=3241168 RepID=UPI00390CA056